MGTTEHQYAWWQSNPLCGGFWLGLVAMLWVCGCAAPVRQHDQFLGLTNFSQFTTRHPASGDTVLLSPEIRSRIAWDQMVVSWNAEAPAGTFLQVEAAARVHGRMTKYYTLGQWSPDGVLFPRTSVRGQQDADGTVDTDTLRLHQPARAVRLRLTLGGTNGCRPALKFIGLSFASTRGAAALPVAQPAAWGQTLAVPERSQYGYPGASGWCSPASLSMVLAYWAQVLHRPELDLPVPQVAAAVYDRDFAGTGNWPFNTAFAGSFPGLRSYVTRFDDLSEVADWIAAGIPVILSTRWDQLEPGRPPDAEGHLVVCVGFTDQGDVVVNDPAARVARGESIRRIYRRENVLRAWTKSHHAVYLVYPAGAKIPRAGGENNGP